jgi:hypothetical protein
MTPIPSLTLNDGTVVPQIGFGVLQIRPEETVEAVTAALEAGPPTRSPTSRADTLTGAGRPGRLGVCLHT